MGKCYVVRAEWDDEAGVWVASSAEVPGLVTEAATVEGLDAKLGLLIPELLEANGCLPGEGGVAFELLACRPSATTKAPRAAVRGDGDTASERDPARG